MKIHQHLTVLALCLTTPSLGQELTTSTLNAGGGLTTGGAVEITGSLGGFAGVADGDDTTARGGFPGQIYDPAHVAITPGDATLQENSALAFAAEVICDDDTLLPADAVTWSVDSPLLGVTPEGLVTAGLLPQSFAAALTASAAGVTGDAKLSVFDSDPDNFGLYAADGLPDSWQTLHFGPDNPNADPAADPDHDGQDNHTEYLAGTDPNDAASFLHLAFADGTPPPGTRVLQFSPYLPDRIYILESSPVLSDPWASLPGTPSAAVTPGAGLISDTAANESRTLYRLRIKVP